MNLIKRTQPAFPALPRSYLSAEIMQALSFSAHPKLGKLTPALLLACGFAADVHAGISQVPLYTSVPSKPNTLVILDNSNSMDEDASGAAVGSNSINSKSEIARSVIKQLMDDYSEKINMGLMTYRQTGLSSMHLHNSPYDVSYNPANYNENYTGDRDSTTKRFRIPNPTNPGQFIHYNVALPFYAGGNMGNGFCYSVTADAFGPNTPVNDRYRCFNQKVTTSDTLPPMPGGGGITAAENAQGYRNLFYDNTFFATDSDIAQGISDFGARMGWNYVGRTWFANSSPGRGFLDIPIRALDEAHGTSLETKLACNIPGSPSPCTNNGVRNAGLTPIEGTLLTAKDYFAGSLTVPGEGFVNTGANRTYPLPDSCNKNFVILLSDGLPSTAQNGVNVTSPEAGITAATAAAGSLKDSGVETYVVGFALPFGADPTTLNKIAVAGGTEAAYLATDYETLSTVLHNIYKDIMDKTNASASLASNSTQLQAGTRIYQAIFSAIDWSGELHALDFDMETYKLDKDWEASKNIPAHADRNIYTYEPSAAQGLRTVDFNWANLSDTQRAHLNDDGKGELRLGWIRGDGANEKKNGGTFRNRANLLGDIVNSNPVYVGDWEWGYDDLPGEEGIKYDQFTSSETFLNRRPMVYVGANDGMLHGFDASNGRELLAYVPNVLFPKLSKLSSPTYSHEYYVDGQINVSDAYYDGSWRTVLVGSTGAGGRSLFALDVTDPEGFGAASALWEFTSANDGDFGYALSEPKIVRLKDGHWVAIVSNGYESDNGHAVLFILDIKTGALLQKIDTGVGTVTDKNGLSAPFVADIDDDYIADVVYAGDLYGNLWKFDLSGIVGSFTAPSAPLFVACTVTGPVCSRENRQAITGQPSVGRVGGPSVGQSNKGVMVYFGTGKYFETGDNIVGSDPQIQTFYGLWDKGSAITDRSSLQEQTILYEGFQTLKDETATPTDDKLTAHPVRVVSSNPVCYSTKSPGCTEVSPSKKGWMLDLVKPVDVVEGERFVSFVDLNHGLVSFSTLIPSSDVCERGGRSWSMDLDAMTGGSFRQPAFSINNDRYVDSKDTVTIDGVDYFASGLDFNIGITSTQLLLSGGINNTDIAMWSGSSTFMSIGNKLNLPGNLGRMSWQQVK